MTADAAPIFEQGLDVFDTVITQVAPDQWDRPTPCAGWTALDVLGHLGTAVAMGISVLRNEQPSWPDVARPADLVEDDPLAHWRRLRDDARAALVGADLALVMDTPMGPRTVAERLAFPAIDLYVHAWDVGQAIGVGVQVPDQVIAFAHEMLDPIPDEMMRGEGGAFGPAVEPPAGADASEEFLAWTGRRAM